MHIEKTIDTGEWQKGRYYVVGETFTYKNMSFCVTEDHLSCDEFHPKSSLADISEGFPFKRVYEVDSITSLTRKKEGQ